MASVKLGAIAQDIRGSLNGMVFSRNRGGQYVRQKVSPVQPVSPWSARSRAIFKSVAQRWSQVLTDEQRAAWSAFAALHPFLNVFGDSILLSGVAFYEAANARLAQCGQAYVDDAPESWTVEDLGTVSIALTIDAGHLKTVTTIGRELTEDEGLFVLVTPPITVDRKLQRNQFVLVNSAADDVFAVADDMGQDIEARLPGHTYAVADEMAFLVAAINTATGAMSVPVQFRGAVAGA
jgi:hypothetical protein